MIISIIVAISNENVIGKQGELPWHLPNDLKHFKKLTSGHCLIMGRKTFESIGKPLPNRKTIIITRKLYYEAENCLVASSLNQALKMALQDGETEAFIAGGGEIYNEAIIVADKLYLTMVDASVEGDTYFPEIDDNEWKSTVLFEQSQDEKHAFAFKALELNRIKRD